MESNLTNTQGTGTPDRRGGTLEIYNTIILAIATLSVAWCSYQSSLWNGIQTFKLADSNKFNRLAQQQTLQIGQNRQIDAAIVSDFLQAVLDKKQKTIEFILRGVRPELSTAMRTRAKCVPCRAAFVAMALRNIAMLNNTVSRLYLSVIEFALSASLYD